jgi:hypothetical protein
MAPPATDEEIAQYAAECSAADVDKCGACFSGPVMAGCASFLCLRDVSKLLARINLLRAERDELEEKWLKASLELARRGDNSAR